MEHNGCKGCAYEKRNILQDPCIKCYGTKTGDHYRKSTNADRIHSMSYEELAELFYSLINLEDKIKFCKNKTECEDILDAGKTIPDGMCKECLVEWLQSEVEE